MPNLTSQLTMKLVDDVSGPAKAVGEAMKKAESTIKAIDSTLRSAGASNSFTRQLSGIAKSAEQVEQVSRAWKEYAQSVRGAETAGNWTKAQTSQMRAWETSTISALKNVTREEKQFEEQQRRLGKLPPPGSAVPGGVSGGGRHGVIRTLPGRVARDVADVAALPAGAGLISAAWDTVKAGADIESEKQKMRAAGIPDEEIERTGKQSADIAARVPTAKISKTMEDYKDLRSVLQDREEAAKLLEDTERARASMNAVDRSGQMAEGLPFAIKGAEILGRTKNEKDYKNYMDSFIRSQQVVGKTITPEQQYEFAKYAKASGATLSDRFVGTTAASLTQELGGQTTGQSVDQFVKQIVGGFQGNQHSAAKEFVRLGLAKEDDFETTKTGEIKGMKPGRHVEGSELAQTDPDKWLYQYGLPAMKRAGITDQKDQIAEIRRMFPSGRSADLVTKMLTQQPSFENHARLYGEAQGMGAVEGNQKDPYQALSAFQAALTNFAGVASGPAIAKATEGLSGLAGAITAVTPALAQWTKDHPNEAAVSAAAGTGVAGYLGGRALKGGIRRALGRGAATTAAEAAGAGEAASVLSLGSALVTLGVAASGATIAIGGLYALMQQFDPLGKEGRKKKDDEILTNEGRQPGGPNENTINPFATGGLKPWVKDMFGGGGQTAGGGSFTPTAPTSYQSGFGREVPDLKAMSEPPGWSMNQPHKRFPEAPAAGGGPEYVNNVTGALDIGAQAQAAAYLAGLQPGLDAAAALAAATGQKIVAGLDVSVSPQISAGGTNASGAPQRNSSLTNYDHGRPSAGGGVTIGQ